MTQLVQAVNGLSADDAINQICLPFLADTVTNIQAFKTAIGAAYCPP